MLLTTYLLLLSLWIVFLSLPYFLNKGFAILAIIASLGLIVTGLTMLADDRGLVVESGFTSDTTEKTGGGGTETIRETQYESIGSFLTNLIQLSTLLGGISMLFIQYDQIYGRGEGSGKGRRL